MELSSFYSYLLKTKPKSAEHYESGLRVVSNDMLREGVISKPLNEMTILEYEFAIIKIFQNKFFNEKNLRGKRMYSNAVKQYQCFLKQNIQENDYKSLENNIKNDESLNETERVQIIKARKGQGIFREELLKKYTSCVISGIKDERLLVASHVKPWSVSTNKERLDAENGLLLSNLFDKMFDIGLITFENSGKIQISSSVNEADKKIFGLDNQKIYELKITETLKLNLEYHRDMIFIA